MRCELTSRMIFAIECSAFLLSFSHRTNAFLLVFKSLPSPFLLSFLSSLSFLRFPSKESKRRLESLERLPLSLAFFLSTRSWIRVGKRELKHNSIQPLFLSFLSLFSKLHVCLINGSLLLRAKVQVPSNESEDSDSFQS